MMMNLDTLKDIVKIAKEEGVSELTVEGKDYKVTVSYASAAAQIVHHAPVASVASVPAAHPAATAKASAHADTGLHVIKSPFVGTFYSSPGPGKPVYAKVGDRVKIGQTLCVLEAMKIMNEIDADVAGEIVEICVDNESLCEFGQPLFKIKP
jgi:acetyl-CoA carboxylase biotin carboxyl carrier protein